MAIDARADFAEAILAAAGEIVENHADSDEIGGKTVDPAIELVAFDLDLTPIVVIDQTPLPDISMATALMSGAVCMPIASAGHSLLAVELVDHDPPMRARRESPPPPPARPIGLAALNCGLAICIGALAAMLARGPIVDGLPRLAAIYRAIGLPARPSPLVITGLAAHIVAIDGKDQLVVEGDIVNRGATRRKLPLLALTVQDEAGLLLYRWEAPQQAQDLEVGAATRFRARLATPPLNGRNVVVRFAKPSGPATSRRAASSNRARSS